MKQDIFDKLEEKVSDIFDKIELKVLLPEEDIFDRLKKELPAVLKKYVKTEKKEIELSDEIVTIIRKEISNIKLPEKVVEKVVERVIEKPKEIRIENPIDVEKLKEEFDLKLKEAIKKAKKDWEESDGGVRMVVAPSQLPNLEHHVGDYLTIENSVDGLRTKWAAASGGLTDGVDVDVPNTNILVMSIIFQPSPGVYYKLNCNANGELQTTLVTP